MCAPQNHLTCWFYTPIIAKRTNSKKIFERKKYL